MKSLPPNYTTYYLTSTEQYRGLVCSTATVPTWYKSMLELSSDPTCSTGVVV